MFAHIQLGVHDLERMTGFYDEVLQHIGMVRFTDLARVGPAGVLWRHPGTRWPQFVLHRPFNGEPATVGNGCQVSFLVRSREAVDAAWRSALARGGTDAGEPGLRPRYAEDFYAAYCLDPEGHKLCFVHTP